MLVDFHTHSTASDGALPPLELLQRAAARGVAAMAITDHDTVGGYAAVRSVVPEGLALFSGVELSSVWGGVNIHVVGLGVDCTHESMAGMLAHLDTARLDRAAVIAQRLERAGMTGALAGASAVAGRSQIGRPHFATWMVESGHAADFNQAFDRWLGRGRTGDVKAYWPPLAESVASITGSGGVAVLAHPLKYGMTAMKLRALVSAFIDAGGRGIEIVSGRQSEDDVGRLRRLAEDAGLAMSLGSDFHREWAYGPDVGVETRYVTSGTGIWELLS